MAKKKTTKKAAKKKAKKKARRRGKQAGQAESVVRQGVPIPPEAEAQIWALREDQLSLRQIAREIPCSVKTVQRVLHRDPERLSTLVRAQVEEREQLWRSIENRSLKQLVALLDEAHSILLTTDGRRRTRRLSDVQAEFLEYARPWAPTLRMAASDAARHQSNLLGRSPAQGRPAGGAGGEPDIPDDMTPEQMVDVAIDLGMVDMLNPVLRELADERLSRRAKENGDGQSEQNSRKARADE